MKKITILSLLMLFTIPNLVISQHIISKVIYKKDNFVTFKNNKNNSTSKLLKEAFTNMGNIEYSLIFTRNQSVFKEIQKMVVDDGNPLAKELSKIIGGGKGVYFTERKPDGIYHQQEREERLFLVALRPLNQWNITQETKKIGKYTCYKATLKDSYIAASGKRLNKEIVAWFTPQIPYPFGPLKYGGLPGLILELQDDKFVFYAKKIQLHISGKIEAKKGILISEKEYDSIYYNSNAIKAYKKLK